MKIAYIADTSLTNRSAYTYNVVKNCDAFCMKSHEVSLLLPFSHKKINQNVIRKIFLLRAKKNFSIKSLLPFKPKNFISRFIFGYISAKYLKKNKYDIIISRSFSSSIFLSLFKVKHFLEIHTELKGLTKFIMINMDYINSKYILKKIFITNALKKKFTSIKKNTSTILPGGVDIKNFKSTKKNIYKIKSMTYIGSFYKGKGIDLILKIAKHFKNIQFNIYGDQLNKTYEISRNVKIIGYIDYNKIPNALSKSDILLLPSANVQFGRTKNINISNYNSPSKMFYYLASGKIILSSKRDGICEVLKHNYNSIIVNKYSEKAWINAIKKILRNKYNINMLMKNSIKTAKKFTYEKRVISILKMNEHLIT